MQKEKWSPRHGEFQPYGGSRVKCSVSELHTSWRWRDYDGVRRRIEGPTFMDGHSRLRPSCGV
jgi:hypothetical protein